MNQWSTLYAPLVGRILLGGFFLWSGIQKVLNFNALTDTFASAGFPEPLYIALAIVCVETLCGIALVVDFKTRLCAYLLAIYLLVTSLIFFQVTTVIGAQVFVENIALVGGLLILGSTGTSKWTPNWRR